MSVDDIVAAVKSASERIVTAWSTMREFDVQPPGIIAEIIVSVPELRRANKAFETLIGSQLTLMHRALSTKYGIDPARQLLSGPVREGSRRISDALPAWVRDEATVAAAAYTVNTFALRYVACGEKSRLGEAVIQCYPQCGIPCGWNELDGVLTLYQPPR